MGHWTLQSMITLIVGKFCSVEYNQGWFKVHANIEAIHAHPACPHIAIIDSYSTIILVIENFKSNNEDKYIFLYYNPYDLWYIYGMVLNIDNSLWSVLDIYYFLYWAHQIINLNINMFHN